MRKHTNSILRVLGASVVNLLLLLGLRIQIVVYHRDDSGHAVHYGDVGCVGGERRRLWIAAVAIGWVLYCFSIGIQLFTFELAILTQRNVAKY